MYYYHELIEDAWTIVKFSEEEIFWRDDMGSVVVKPSSVVFCSNKKSLRDYMMNQTFDFTIGRDQLPFLKLEKEIKNCVIDIFYHR